MIKKKQSEEADRRQVRGSEKADTVEKVTDSEGRDEVRRKGAAQKDKEQEGKKDAAIVLFCKFTFIIPSLRLSNAGEYTPDILSTGVSLKPVSIKAI